jgi:hypothetical protein
MKAGYFKAAISTDPDADKLACQAKIAFFAWRGSTPTRPQAKMRIAPPLNPLSGLKPDIFILP